MISSARIGDLGVDQSASDYSASISMSSWKATPVGIFLKIKHKACIKKDYHENDLEYNALALQQ